MQNKPIVIGLFTLVLAACGFMFVGQSTHQGDDAAEIQTTVKTYVRAFVRGDGEAVCKQLTESARLAVNGMAGQIGASDCAGAIERSRSLGGPEVIAVARKIRIGQVDVSGATARVTLKAAGQDSVAELEKVGGEWKISSLPRR